MAEQRVERRLAAILAADVAGYSRLMGEDEEGTLAALTAHLAELIEPCIDEHRGRVVKTTGDGLLAEFASVVDAVRCAVAFQDGMRMRNADAPRDSRIEFRIGVNLGDVIIQGGDVYGDGVNVAARLEGIGTPGGICVSGNVFEQVEGRLDLRFDDLGERRLKNIARPTRVYAVPGRGAEAMPAPVGYAPPPLPDKPSVAVLPFDNLSGDPSQEFFADGMTEDITSGLSRFRSLFVIARNSAFAYKGKSPDIRDVARDLGVRYVLEGSVRRGGGRVRITGQLIDAGSGNHIWAERYDRELEDVFAVQDEVTDAIVAAIAPVIGDEERARAQRKPPESLEAWDIYQRGLAAYHSSTDEGLASAIGQFDKVNEVDPSFAPAFAMGAYARSRHVLHFMPENRDEILSQAREKARTAITLDPSDPTCLWADGRVHSMLGDHDAAVSRLEEAVALNPNDATMHFLHCAVLCSAGRAEQAIPHIDHALRLSPRDIHLTGMLTHRAFALFDLERYEEAFEWARRASLQPNPRSMTFALLAAVSTRLGRADEARAALEDLRAHAPGMTCAKYRDNPFGTPEVMARFADALREAGLAE